MNRAKEHPWSRTLIWLTLAFFALQAVGEGMRYIFSDPRYFDALFREKYTSMLPLVQTHGVAASTALLVGLLQFRSWPLKKGWHRWLGRIYMLSILVAAATALPMAARAEGGLSSRCSFTLLALLWVATGYRAYQSARQGRFQEHRQWMVRNFSLTYSAVLSRLLLNGLQAGGFEFLEIYPLVTWSWLLGLSTGEWWLWYSQQLDRRRREP